MKEILFFEPLFKEKIWGGTRLKTLFNIESDNPIGEAWLLSGMPGNSTQVAEGTFKGMTMQALWQVHSTLLGGKTGPEFPFLIKIIDAAKDLSIQVHPGESQAKALGGEARSKSECWYVMDAPLGSRVVLGHNALSREEFEQLNQTKDWKHLLKIHPIHKGDLINIPAGTLHALKKGTMVLEIQEPSDTTYRLYDYDRLENGKPRPLHVKECLDSVTIPQPRKKLHFSLSHHLYTPHFNIFRLVVYHMRYLFHSKGFMVLCVVEGSGSIDGLPLNAGDCFLVPENYGPCRLQGHLVMIAVTDPAS